MKDDWDNKNWEGIGQSFQLFSTQLLKYEAPTVKQSVELME